MTAIRVGRPFLFTTTHLRSAARPVPSRPLMSAEPSSFAEGAPDRMQRSLLSSSVVGSANRGFVIQALFDLGPTSRAELARRAGSTALRFQASSNR